MKLDILTASQEEIEAELKRGYFKQIVLGATPDIPKEAKKAFLYVGSKLKQSKYYKEDYSIAYIEEYIPMMGKVWRMFVYNKQRATGQLHNAINNHKDIGIKALVGSNQIISIYYDDDNILSITGMPYFEIYDGNDIERFWINEYKDLLTEAERILKAKY